MDSPVNQEFVELVSSRGWDIRRMEKPEKAACRKYIYDEIFKYLRNNDTLGQIQRSHHRWIDLRFNQVRIITRGGVVSRWFQLDAETSGEILTLLYFWSYNERNKRRVKLIGNFHELCQGGKIRKVIPMDLLRYIMEFY